MKKFCVVCLFVFLALGLLWCGGFRVNVTPSLPLGLYRISKDQVINRGDIVLFCLESESFIPLAGERGYLGYSDLFGRGLCPGGLRPLGKMVYGLPGDTISIGTDGTISINGELIEGSAARSQDSKGRAMPASLLHAGVVPPGRILPLSLRIPGSFDGRYFGLIDLAGCRKLRPVWVRGK